MGFLDWSLLRRLEKRSEYEVYSSRGFQGRRNLRLNLSKISGRVFG